VFVAGQSVPMIPGVLVLRDVGVPLLTTLACWVAGLVYCWREPTPVRRPEAFGVAA
jgi:hypothetical protein